MSTSRRKSARSNNATNINGQQNLETTLKRQAQFKRPAALALQHIVLAEQLYSRIWDVYDKYAARNPLLQSGDDGAAAPGARGTRRRAARQAAIEGQPEAALDGCTAEALSAAMKASEAASAAAAARAWEHEGHQCLELLEPLVAGNVTLPKQLQEALMVMVLSAEQHPGGLTARAAALLDRLLEAHPPAKQEDENMSINEELWEPVSCSWSARQHKDVSRLLWLRRCDGLAVLVASAHNLVARAAAEALGKPLPVAQVGKGARGAEEVVPPHGDIGRTLLLKYWVRVLQMDLDVRLGALRRSGYSDLWKGELENSLAVRLLQTTSSWADGNLSKPVLVRQLAMTVVYAHMAAAAGAQLQPGSTTPAADNVAVQLLCGPAEVGHVAATLLNVLYDAHEALQRMGVYRRRGSIGRDNDLVRMDMALARSLNKDLQYKEPSNLQVLLTALGPTHRVRLLTYMVADAAGRRSEVGDQLKGGLRYLYEYYQDQGTSDPPQVRASAALQYLLQDDPATSGRVISNWNWATSYSLLPAPSSRVGLALLATTLTTAALQQAQQEQARAQLLRQRRQVWQEQEQPPHGMDVDGEDGGGAGPGPEAWAEEAASVAKLYVRVAARLQSEGVGVAVALETRCADQMASRVLRGGGPEGMSAT